MGPDELAWSRLLRQCGPDTALAAARAQAPLLALLDASRRELLGRDMAVLVARLVRGSARVVWARSLASLTRHAQ